MKYLNLIPLLPLLLSISVSSSCSSLKPYQPTQYQGTEISQDKVDQLEIGLTKNQVVYLLGQPALTNTLTPNTWQYLYTKKSQEKLNIEQSVTLLFDEAGKLSEIKTK